MEKCSLHDAILSEVHSMFRQGKKHISIIMPTGSGKIFLMNRIIGSFHGKSVVIASQREIRFLLMERNRNLFDTSTTPLLSVEDYLQDCSTFCRDNNSPELLYILFATTPSERLKLIKTIPKTAAVVSIGFNPRIMADSFTDVSVYPFECWVFYSEKILDVRDLIVASESERQVIIKQISEKKSRYDRLLYGIRTATINASPEASEAEVEELREKILEKNRLIAEKEETINMLESLLAAAGISKEDVRKSMEVIRRIKYENNSEKSEIEQQKIADAISEQSQRLFARYVTFFSKEYYTSVIQSSITRTVWDKMIQESKTCLITGKIAYQSMVNTGDDSLDYSGVCILASKALDLEMSKRFFHNYITYLNRYYPRSSWPNTLFDEEDNVLSDKEFTLGSIKYVVGIDKSGMVRNRYVNRMFLRYAEAELYDVTLSRDDIKNHLKNCIESIEVVRERYRNPAAHRAPLSRITAEECFDYLIDTYKKLKEILEVMK